MSDIMNIPFWTELSLVYVSTLNKNFEKTMKIPFKQSILVCIEMLLKCGINSHPVHIYFDVINQVSSTDRAMFSTGPRKRIPIFCDTEAKFTRST